MRTPERPPPAHPRAGKEFEADLNLRYLSPGAFTILPPDQRIPDPPSAPLPYRITPTVKRHKHQSFAIIGETPSSTAGSRSSSPSGRVSPFKGHGFNPTGSRHVSPSISPVPPEDPRLTPTNNSPRHTSKIPQFTRRGSAAAFGEKVTDFEKPPRGNHLNTQLSQSLTSLEAKKTAKRPHQSPRRTAYTKTPAFQRLSPIVGSSPEPSQSLSSPSRIPTSRSTPPSRITSPTRTNFQGRPPQAKTSSKPVSRSNSRSRSRDTSPSKILSQIPATKYRNVTAKVNSFNKPKVPPKPHLTSEESEDTEILKKTKNKPPLNRKSSVNKLRTDSKSNLIDKTLHINKNSDSIVVNKPNNNALSKKPASIYVKSPNITPKTVTNNTKNAKKQQETTPRTKPRNNKNINHNDQKDVVDKNGNTSMTNSSEEEKPKPVGIEKLDNLHSTTAVVSSTTTTVTKPLQIEAKLPTVYDKPKAVSPIVDGRVLSATSVSHAINKMNDTVLNTQTVIKEHGFSKLSPAANAIISVANENKSDISSIDVKNSDTKTTKTNSAIVPNESKKKEESEKATENKDVQQTDTKLFTIEKHNIEENKAITNQHKNTHPNNNNLSAVGTNKNLITNTVNTTKNNINHVSHVGIGTAKALEMEVQRNMDKLISPDGLLGNSTQKIINDRIKEARTVIAADVKPIRIMVKGKPSDEDVQSGNIRPSIGLANGLNERPSLPPEQESANDPPKEEKPKNVCSRIITSCKDKMSCGCCKKQTEQSTDQTHEEKPGCFGCFKRTKQDQPIRINIEEDPKEKFWNKFKCCGKNKVGDTTPGCFSMGKRKESWIERRESVLSTPAPASRCSKDACKALLANIFCLGLCCKKKDPLPDASRKASVISSNKKKSLTPASVLPPEEIKPKIDMSLVEHTSHMRGAIPILPVCLAWFCLVMNCIGPGTGTVFSGLFCLCLGIPRFSQKDGPKQRIGAFIINLLIGFSQFFTVLFCLVGWGWSIWWGVIMVKIAKKHKKLKHLEIIENASISQQSNVQGQHRDPERGK